MNEKYFWMLLVIFIIILTIKSYKAPEHFTQNEASRVNYNNNYGYDNQYAINQVQNGRVTDVLYDQKPTQLMYENLNGHDISENFQYEALYGIQEPSLISKTYFSRANMDIIQDEIKKSVYIKTGNKYVISRQSDTELFIIMRGMYLQHSVGLDTDITKQIEYLNSLVVNWSVEQIIPEIEQRLGYLNDIQYMPMPNELPRNMSTKGTRTLRSVTTTF